MKIIFLDVDGVLNTQNTFEEIYNEKKLTGNSRVELDMFRIEILSYIVAKTKAKIVLSSSWRHFFKKYNGELIPRNKASIALVDSLKKYGLEIYDITPYDPEGIRQNEINAWLTKRNDIESFIVIDDDINDLMDFKDKELIQTTFYGPKDVSGLCLNHALSAIQILNNYERNKEKINIK